MTHNRLAETLTKVATGAMKSSRFIALAMVAAFTSMAMQPAQAQSSDTWKSVAIIGGSTVAGAYIGHKVAGSTGAWVGAAAGASTGYAIDKRRRAGEYNQYAYGDNGYYGNNNDPYYGNNNDPYYGNNDPYYGNDGYYGGSTNGAYPYPSGYQSSSNYRNSNRFSRRH